MYVVCGASVPLVWSLRNDTEFRTLKRQVWPGPKVEPEEYSMIGKLCAETEGL
jgi:hypothetical protein